VSSPIIVAVLYDDAQYSFVNCCTCLNITCTTLNAYQGTDSAVNPETSKCLIIAFPANAAEQEEEYVSQLCFLPAKHACCAALITTEDY